MASINHRRGHPLDLSFLWVTKFHVCQINEIEPKEMHKRKEETLEAASLSSSFRTSRTVPYDTEVFIQ